MTLKFPVEPMKAALGSLPPDDGTWAFEIKWDGYRTVAFIDDGSVRLQSSTGLDATAKYPEIAGLAGSVNARAAILDGELVVLDDNGRPNFGLMQQHQRQAVFYAFDVLSIDGTDTIALPYEQRRHLLEHLVEPEPNWMVPAHRIGGGSEFLAASAAQGLEGLMAKKLGSPYQPGKRSPAWRKVKNRVRVDVTIGGYTTGTGSRSNAFGALLVGVDTDHGLRFAGGVGTGFTQSTLEGLHQRLRGLQTDDCPFAVEPPRTYSRDATWVRPTLRATVEIAEFTNEGYVRHASFIQLTPDTG